MKEVREREIVVASCRDVICKSMRRHFGLAVRNDACRKSHPEQDCGSKTAWTALEDACTNKLSVRLEEEKVQLRATVECAVCKKHRKVLRM